MRAQLPALYPLITEDHDLGLKHPKPGRPVEGSYAFMETGYAPGYTLSCLVNILLDLLSISCHSTLDIQRHESDAILAALFTRRLWRGVTNESRRGADTQAVIDQLVSVINTRARTFWELVLVHAVVEDHALYVWRKP